MIVFGIKTIYHNNDTVKKLLLLYQEAAKPGSERSRSFLEVTQLQGVKLRRK